MRIGDENFIKVKLPFVNKLNGLYKIEQITSISEMSRTIDLYKLLYFPNGLTRENLIDDSNNGVSIIKFVNSNGTILEIPSNRVSKLNDNDVPYVSKGIGIKLERLPRDTSLDITLVEIKNIINTNLGVDCNLSVTDVEALIPIDYDEHVRLELSRKTKIKKQPILSYKTLLSRFNELTIAYNKLMSCYKTKI